MRRLSTSAFTLIELLISLAIIGILVGLLLPMLLHAKTASSAAVCASNLRQLGVAWLSYAQDFEQFPRHATKPAWAYGGVVFSGVHRVATLDLDRPLNRYLKEDLEEGDRELAKLFQCPGDRGVFVRDGMRSNRVNQLPEPSCYQTFGTSYRANDALLDSTTAGIDSLGRPLRLSEIHVSLSRLLLTGDTAWFYATRIHPDPEANFEATWHAKFDAGNFLAVDGSVRFVAFAAGSTDITLFPRPESVKAPRPQRD
ncbi:MAG: prepilin-type N-terminal cleavage/methylation domain-containing protein [Planctomycetota bacterium]|nr:prepilin-type N-terminal cleavage/methylation domain-containing protein [Planctomycetota bacterium]